MNNLLKSNSLHKWVALGTAVLLFALYLSTLAQGLILGDPTEYTYVAHVLGIAHPPGYAFITLSGKLFQTLVPFGTIVWRMHVHAAVWGTIGVMAAFGTVHTVLREKWMLALMGAVFVAVSIGTGTDYWQHSIHANPHIMTAVFLSINIFLLTRWQATEDDRYLLAFSLSTGLGVTHHPLTVFSFPAYTVFILLVRPRIAFDWRLLLKMVGMAALGLSLFLYYPIRSAMEPLVGPHTMNTMQGFLDHVLGRGLTESLPYFSLAEQPIRLLVFGAIARLQYSWVTLLCALLGVGFLVGYGRKSEKQWLVLLVIAFLCNYGFVMSLKQQDIMAYILGPLLIVGLFSGVGFAALMAGLMQWRPATGIFILFLTFGGFIMISERASDISLRDFSEGDDHVTAVFEQFAGEGDGVVLLNNWEFMTPLWYTQLVDEQWPPEEDVRPVFVSAAEPWLPSVFNYLPGGPVYLNSYRREIVDAGFRLRPRDDFYQVVEPADGSIPPELTLVDMAGDGIDLMAYGFPERTITAGDFVPLTVAMRVPEATADYFVPVVQVGDIQLPFTTDTHLVSPLWQAGEVIIERFDFALPHELPAGDYPVSVRIQNLSQNVDAGVTADLGELTVEAHPSPPQTDELLANFRHRVGLRSAAVWDGLGRKSAPWPNEEPIYAARGDVLTVVPEWEALAKAEESYTIFVHLIDPSNQLYLALDYTPLGGATPTHLWFPKWLPGQTMIDPYRMVIPEELAPGTYLIEVGVYEMTSGRRLHMHDLDGDIIGDRYILGAVVVE